MLKEARWSSSDATVTTTSAGHENTTIYPCMMQYIAGDTIHSLPMIPLLFHDTLYMNKHL